MFFFELATTVVRPPWWNISLSPTSGSMLGTELYAICELLGQDLAERRRCKTAIVHPVERDDSVVERIIAVYQAGLWLNE